MANTWFTSDLHFSHTNILKYCPWNRPFADAEVMNQYLLEMWNDTVKPGDTVYFLGDFAMKFNTVLDLAPKLSGKIVWVPGNHCHIHKMHKGWEQNRQKLLKVQPNIIDIQEQLTIGLGGVKLLLCHFPWAEDVDNHSEEHSQYGDRFKDWRPIRSKNPHRTLLFGHKHSRPEARLIKKGIEISYDSWGRMVSLEEILEIVKEQM